MLILKKHANIEIFYRVMFFSFIVNPKANYGIDLFLIKHLLNNLFLYLFFL